MSAPDYPAWDRAVNYEIAAVEAVEQMRTAITDNQLGAIVDRIDDALKALHQLRQAAVSENRRQQDALMARLDAEDAARKARPAVPPAEVAEQVREMVADRLRAMPVKVLREHTGMTLAEAVAYVDELAGTREGVTSK